MVRFKIKFTLFSHQRQKITCLDQFSNEWLVSGGSRSDTIEIWDLNKRVCIRVIYSGRVTKCLQAFEKIIDDKIESYFAACNSSGFLGIWNASNGACVKEFPDLMPGKAYSLILRSNDELLCTSSKWLGYQKGITYRTLTNLKTLKQSKLDKETWRFSDHRDTSG